MAFSTHLKLVPTQYGHDAICSIKYPGIGATRDASLYVSKIRFIVNDEIVANFNLGPNVSHDPIIGIHLRDLKTEDRVSAQWIDILGRGDDVEIFVK